MAREKEHYRAVLEDIISFAGGKRVLSVKAVSNYTGKTEWWCKKHLPFKDNCISAVVLARALA